MRAALRSSATSGPALVALSYAFDQGGSIPVPFTPDDGVFVFSPALDLSRLTAGAHTLTVKARQMHGDGYKFYLSANGVWLTDHVPPQYIEGL